MTKVSPKGSGGAAVEELYLIPRQAGGTTESAYQQSIHASTMQIPANRRQKAQARLLKKKAKKAKKKKR